MPLSPYVEKPLNPKVIKSFVPELRSRPVFFEFRDSYVVCIYIYEHPMYISHIHVYGYGIEIPYTVSRTNRRKELLMSELELGIQSEVSRSNWSTRKE